MTVLVTGASGLLGSHLTELLIARGRRVRALVRPGESLDGLAEAPVEVCWGDMADRDSLRAAVRDVEVVLHCAARTGPWGAAPEYERTNVRGLETLLESAIAAGVTRFVHVSSITVHGNDVGGAADERSPFRDEPNPYTRSKIAGERLLETWIRERDAPVTIVRPGWIYGPGDVASFSRFATMIREGRMVVVGSGLNHVPLIYVRDAAQGIVLAGERSGAVGRSYLLVNDEPVTQLAYLNAIAGELGVAGPRRHIPYRLGLTLGATAETAYRLMGRSQPPPLTRFGLQLLGGENRFSIKRARAELGFSPHVMVAEGVRLGVEWLRQRSAARVVQTVPA
jgi:nucleoside-diphosphate-sugar epimerase